MKSRQLSVLGSFLLVKWVHGVGGAGHGGEPKFTGQRVARRTDGGARAEPRAQRVRGQESRREGDGKKSEVGRSRACSRRPGESAEVQTVTTALTDDNERTLLPELETGKVSGTCTRPISAPLPPH